MQVPLWRSVIHDWSKFTLAELPAYGQWFFGGRGNGDAFAKAWVHHQNLNPHHWEYWVTRSTHRISVAGPATAEALPMPETYIREMVADWMGASKAYTGQWEIKEWVVKNLPKMNLHEATLQRLGELIELTEKPVRAAAVDETG
jgi:hypothetical protein